MKEKRRSGAAKGEEGKPRTLLGVVGFGLLACVLYGVGGGLRTDVGILLEPVMEESGLCYEDVSMAIALLQLAFGASQPVFGMVASRTSSRLVICAGIVLMAAGLALAPFASSPLFLMLALGVLFGSGCGAVSFGLVLASAMRVVGARYAMTVSGMLNAAAGMGAFALSPTIQAMLGEIGTRSTMAALAASLILLVPLAFLVTRADGKAAGEGDNGKPVGIRELFRDAFSNRTYRLLIAGFSTCGFHMVLIEAHLFSQFVSYGIDPGAASWAFSLYGVFTIAGALLSGYLSSRIDKGRLVAFYYGFRAVWVALFVFAAPKTLAACIVFIAGLGMTGDATVMPTVGLVHQNFPLGRSATLIGFLFLVHQLGAFASSWLGGLLLVGTGGYEAVWILDIAACTLAFAMSARIGKGGERGSVTKGQA